MRYVMPPAGVGDGVELRLGEGEAHRVRPICWRGLLPVSVASVGSGIFFISPLHRQVVD